MLCHPTFDVTETADKQQRVSAEGRSVCHMHSKENKQGDIGLHGQREHIIENNTGPKIKPCSTTLLILLHINAFHIY